MQNPNQYRASKYKETNEAKKSSVFVEKNEFKRKDPKTEGASGRTVIGLLMLFFGTLYFIASSNDREITRKKEEIQKSAKESGLVIKENVQELALLSRDCRYRLTVEEACLLSDIASKAAPGLPGGYGAKNVLSALLSYPEYYNLQTSPERIHRDLMDARGSKFDFDDAIRLHRIFNEFNMRASEETKIKMMRHIRVSSLQCIEDW